MKAPVTQTGALRAWWSAVMVLAASVLVAGAGIVYTRHVQHQAEQRYIEYTRRAQQQADSRWCPVLIIADRPRPTQPPQTPDEAEARKNLHQLRIALGCGGP